MAKHWATLLTLALVLAATPNSGFAQEDEVPPTAPVENDASAPEPPMDMLGELEPEEIPAPAPLAQPEPTPTPTAAQAQAKPEAPPVPAPVASEAAKAEVAKEEPDADDILPVPEQAPEVASEPAPDAPAEPPTEDIIAEASTPEEPARTQTRRRSRRIPVYQQVDTHWGIAAAYSHEALGKSELAPEQEGSVRAFTLAGEYQPFRAFGILSLGASAGIYPSTGIAKSPFSIYSVGGQIRYQARFFREQPLVPAVAYHFDYFNYWLSSTGASGRILAKGPSLGVWILLNFFDVQSAAQFYADYGIARSYLVAEIRNTGADNGMISFSGNSYFFGLRFEL